MIDDINRTLTADKLHVRQAGIRMTFRDMFLRRLISGQLRLAEAEALAEEAIA